MLSAAELCKRTYQKAIIVGSEKKSEAVLQAVLSKDERKVFGRMVSSQAVEKRRVVDQSSEAARRQTTPREAVSKASAASQFRRHHWDPRIRILHFPDDDEISFSELAVPSFTNAVMACKIKKKNTAKGSGATSQ